jgi:pilus assembly protein CpaB
MRAKTILTVLFLISLAVASIVILRALPVQVEANANAVKEEVLVAAVPLAPGTFVRAEDLTWAPIARAAEPGEIVRPPEAVRGSKPEIDEATKTQLYGAAVRPAHAMAAGQPIRRSDVVKPGDRDFLQVVLGPGARAIAFPVVTNEAGTGLLFPGDRVDVILTQNFKADNAPITRRSVSETVVENLRVLTVDVPDPKVTARVANGNSSRTVTLEVTAEQAEKINVATELGKISLTLRGGPNDVGGPAVGQRASVKPTWAGDVSPALGGAMPEKAVTAHQPLVEVIHGSRRSEAVKTE